MTTRKPVDLRRKGDDVVTIHIPLRVMVSASIIFAIIFWIIGVLTMHYPSINGVI